MKYCTFLKKRKYAYVTAKTRSMVHEFVGQFSNCPISSFGYKLCIDFFQSKKIFMNDYRVKISL